MFAIKEDVSVAYWRQRARFMYEPDMDHMLEGLLKAGLRRSDAQSRTTSRNGRCLKQVENVACRLKLTVKRSVLFRPLWPENRISRLTRNSSVSVPSLSDSKLRHASTVHPRPEMSDRVSNFRG